MTATPNGHGYWLAAADGRVFSFGNAPAMHAVPAPSPIVGLERNRTGKGLWLVASDGTVHVTGAAKYARERDRRIRAGGRHRTRRVRHGLLDRERSVRSAATAELGHRPAHRLLQQGATAVARRSRTAWSRTRTSVSGRHGLPSVGVHQVFSKVPSSPSGDLTLPWTLRFAHGSSGAPIDIHGIPLRPDGTPIEPDSLLGTPESHGCVRMNQADAEFVWNWASVGTVVVVTDLGY